MTGTTLEGTPDGRRLVVSRAVDAPADEAWTLLIDTWRWPEWGPSVRAVDCEDRYITAGSTGHVRTAVGLRVPFEITTCVDRRWTWRVARIPATGHRVETTGPDACRVAFEVPPLAAPYAPVCEVALGRIASLLR